MINESKRKGGNGVLVLVTHQNQIEQFGEEEYLFRQSRMFKNDMTEDTENE